MIRFFEYDNNMSENIIKSCEISQMGTTFSWIFLKNYQRWEIVIFRIYRPVVPQKEILVKPKIRFPKSG
jgi:hypothetical protein